MAHQPLCDEIQRYGLPRRPGLGIELDPEVIATHPYAPGDHESAYCSDGSVADI
jgi:L-alanine-DL-glutamate epimerase-like enolase superfamily enzyme